MSTSRITPSPSNFILKSSIRKSDLSYFLGHFHDLQGFCEKPPGWRIPNSPGSSFSFPMGGKLAVDASGPLAQRPLGKQRRPRPIRNWTWKWCSNWKCKVTRIYHIYIYIICVDVVLILLWWMINYTTWGWLQSVTGSSCRFLIISVFICPPLRKFLKMTILTHTHTHTTKNTNTCGNHRIPLQYSIKQLCTILHWRLPSFMDLDGSNNSTVKQEPQNESLPTHPSFHLISEAMNPRESTWHTCCCSAFPVRPWKSTSQRLESSTGIYQCRTAPKKKHGKLTYGFKHIYEYIHIVEK